MTESDLERAREIVSDLFAAALRAVEPARAVRSALDFHNGTLIVDGVDIPAPRGVHVVAVGKAAVAMTRGALDGLDGAIVSGDVITKEGHVDHDLPESVRVYEAGHPIPDPRGVEATRAMLEHLSGVAPGTVILALISGGGSALLEAPREGVSLEDFAETTDLLLRAGAPIDALNAVRAPLSRVKAGGLREAAPDAVWVTLILSDVLGNDPLVIASGPTVSGPRDPAAALEIVDRFGVRDRLPEPVLNALTGAPPPRRSKTPRHDTLLIIGDNAAAVDAAAAEARARGLEARIVWNAVEGEAVERGREFVGLAAEAPEDVDLLLGGGEMTVTVRGDGVGGRNTEFALGAALEMERRAMRDWVVASLGTDGQDAMTGLAGAIVDAGTAARARERGADPDEALQNNDSSAVFAAAGGGVDTGPTGTNVNDLYVALRIRARE